MNEEWDNWIERQSRPARLLKWVAAAAIGLAVIGALAAPALSHSWYSGACCSDQDCAPIARDRIEWTREGWRVTLRPGDHPMSQNPVSEIVPFDQTLPSQDGDFHACVRASLSPAAATQERIICLYVPQGAAGA